MHMHYKHAKETLLQRATSLLPVVTVNESVFLVYYNWKACINSRFV